MANAESFADFYIGSPTVSSPTVTSSAATGVSTDRATANGEVTANGNGAITERGFVLALQASADPTTATNIQKILVTDTTGTFSNTFYNLAANTQYKYRPYATNSAGTSYGPATSFITHGYKQFTAYAVMQNTGGGESTLTLWNRTDSVPVSSVELTTTSPTPVLVTKTFNATDDVNFVDGKEYEFRPRGSGGSYANFWSAGIYIKLKNFNKVTTYNRISRIGFTAMTADAAATTQRFLYTAANYTSPVADWIITGTEDGGAGTSVFQMYNVTTTDSGTTGSLVAGTGIDVNSTSKTWGTVTGVTLVDTNRYIGFYDWTSGGARYHQGLIAITASGTPGAINTQTQIELLDVARSSQLGVAYEPVASRTPFTTAHFDNTTYYFETIATNNHATLGYGATLVAYNAAGTTTDVTTQTLTANTGSSNVRYRTGAITIPTDTVELRVRLAGTAAAKNVVLGGARVIAVQANPTKTLIHIPMAGSNVEANDDRLFPLVTTNNASANTALANNVDQFTIWKRDDTKYDLDGNTIAPNSPADGASVGSYPTLQFTGTDGKSQDLSYVVELSDTNTFGEKPIDFYHPANTSAGFSLSPGNWYGYGQAFNGNGDTLSSSAFLLANSNIAVNVGNLVSKVYATTGALGSTAVATGSPLATSDLVPVEPLGSSYTLVNFPFSGANRIVLTRGTTYAVMVEYPDGQSDVRTFTIALDQTSPSHAGNAISQSGVSTFGAVSTADVVFYVYGANNKVVRRISGIHSGFTGTPDGTDPFTSAQQVSFTVQSADALTAGDWYWRAAATNADGHYMLGPWTATRRLAVTASAPQFTISHTTSANKKKAENILSHTTSANKKVATIISHTTSSNKKVSGNTRTHTTSASIRKPTTIALSDNFNDNSVDAAKWGRIAVDATREQEINGQATFTTLANSTNYYGFRSVNTYDLTGKMAYTELVDAGNQSLVTLQAVLKLYADVNNAVTVYVRNGNIYAQKQVANVYTDVATVAYNSTTHRWIRISEYSGTTYWEYSSDGLTWLRLHSEANPITMTALTAEVLTGTYGATEATATTVIFDNFNTQAPVVTTRTHTTSANKRVAENIVSHTTSANKKVANNTRTHTTDANKKKSTTISHTTSSVIRKANTLTHTTSANKKVANNTVSHTTSANKKVAGNTRTHTTNALLRKQFTLTHTTSANKKVANNTVSHTTSANKKVAANTRTHTTDALKRKQFTVSHTTNANLKKATTVAHTTSANKKVANNLRTHTTDANKKKATTVFHTTSANKKVAANTRTHTTDANKKRANNTLTHTTSSVVRKANTLSHTTSSYLTGFGRYWIGGTGNWSDTAHWSLFSGGSGGAPVPTQYDDAIFDANSFSGTGFTVTFDTDANSKNFDASAVGSDNPTFAGSSTVNIYGDFKLATGTTWAHTYIIMMLGTGSHIIDTKGITMPITRLRLDGFGTYTLASNFKQDKSGGDYEVWVRQGTFALSTFTVEANNFYVDDTFNWGTGTVKITDHALDINTGTVTNSSTGHLIYAGTNKSTFYPTGWIDTGDMTFASITIEDVATAVEFYANITATTWTFEPNTVIHFDSAKTYTGSNWNFNGTSGNVVTMNRWNVSGQFTFSDTSGTNTGNYLTISNNIATGGATWVRGTGFTGTNVSGWRQTVTASHSTSANKRTANLTLTHTTDALKKTRNTLSHTTSAYKRTATVSAKSVYDNFNDNSIDPAKWTQFSGATEQNQRLEIISALSSSYRGFTAVPITTLVGSEMTIEVVDAGNQSITSWELYPLQVLKEDNVSQYAVWWYISGGNLQAWKKVAGTQTQMYTVAYVNATHRWLRIRESSGTVYWDTSTDGLTWTNRATELVSNLGWDFTNVTSEISAGTWQAEGSTTAAYLDNYNVIQPTVSHTTSAYKHTATQTFTRTHTTDANKRRATVISHTTSSNLKKTSTVSHTTSSNLKRTTTVSHTTDANKKRANNTVVHTTSANKRLATTISHTTSANKRVAGNTRTHTTNSVLRKANTASHTTNALLRKQFTLSHTTDALKRKANIVSHTTSANKRLATVISHTTSSNKKVAGNTRTHTTSSVIRKANTLTHTTSANKKKSGNTLTHTTSAYKVHPNFTTTVVDNFNDNSLNTALWEANFGNGSVTETNNRMQLVINSGASGFDYAQLATKGGRSFNFVGQELRYQVITYPDNSQKKAYAFVTIGVTRAVIWSYTNGTLSAIYNTGTDTVLYSVAYSSTYAWQRIRELSGTIYFDTSSDGVNWTNRASQVPAGTLFLDAVYGGFEIDPVGTTTSVGNFYFDNVNIGAQYTITHTTDALKRKANTLTHTTSSVIRKQNTLSHTTSANKKVASNTLTHTTDALKRKATVVSHTTDSNKRKATTVSHTTSSNLKVSGITRSHTTDSLLRKATTVSHTTSAVVRKQNVISHTTSSNKKKTSTLTHTTSAFISKPQYTRTHTADALKTVGSTTTTAYFYTSGSGDDAQETISTGAVTTTIQQPVISGLYHVGYRFPNITIPQGTTITSAKLQTENYASGTDNFTGGFDGVTVKGQAADNPINFGVGTNDIANRAVTTATGQDVGPLTNNIWGSLTAGHGLAVTTIVQELLNRGGWASGNAMVILFKGSGTESDKVTVYHWDYFTGNQDTRLEIVYTTAAARSMSRNHTTDSYKRLPNPNYSITHTTDALKRKATTASHTTNSVLRKANTLSHTTSANKRAVTTVAHTTNSLLRKQNTVSHTTSANKRRATTIVHTTDANKKRSNNVLTHTTNANKRTTGNLLTHTTNSLLRKANTVSHTTDANKKKSTTITHTTSANKRVAGNVVSHTTSSNKRVAGNTRTHTTDTYKRTATVVTFYPSLDGTVSRTGVDETFSTIRNGAGNAFNNTNTNDATQLASSSTSSQYSTLARAIFSFDTSSIPDDATINSVTFSLYGQSKASFLGTPDLHVAGATPASTSTLANSDYANVQRTSFGTVSHASFSTTGYNDITLNASGIAQINKLGFSSFSTQLAWDLNNAFSGSWTTSAPTVFSFYMSEDSGTTRDPKLVVSYSLPPLVRHTTDALKRKATTVSHTTSSNKKVSGNVVSHTTSSNKKRANNLVSHTTDANKKKSGNTVSHTTNSQLYRATETVFYYFDGSDGITAGIWSNASNAFDSNHTGTSASAAGAIPPNYLKGEGTNAPTTGNTITQVRVRINGSSAQLFGILGEVWTNGLAQQLGTAYASGGWGSYTTLSTPTGGWTWQKLNDLEVRFAYDEKNAGSGSNANVFGSDIEVTYSNAATVTRTHTTDANKRKETVISHTTNALKRTANTISHTTSSSKRVTGNIVSHTTSSNLRKATLVSHTTDSNKRRATTVAHTTSANLKKSGNIVSHTTSSNLKKTTTVSHTTNALKRSSNVLTHTTNSLKRAANTLTHTTNALKRTATAVVHTTNALLRKQNTVAHTTDANRRKATTVSHTTDSNKRRATTVSHTTSANKRVAAITLSHTTNSLLRRAVTLTHTTNANKRTANALSHTTNSVLRKANTLSHTTDANKRKVTLVSHSTDANKKRANNVLTHTTSSVLRKLNSLSHTTNALLRKQFTLSHTTNALKRTQNTLTHTTNSLLRKANTVSHTTSSNKRKATVVSHTTDSLKRTANVLSHTTNALKRTLNSISHTTNALLRRRVELTHTTSSFLRSANSVTHTTDANKRRAYSVSHTTDANKKRADNVVTHTTSSVIRKSNIVAHTTNALKRTLNVLTHSTNALLRKANTVSHTTNALVRKSNSTSHTTSANKRLATVVSHTTDSNKKTANNVVTHTTNALKRTLNTVSHTTNAFLRTRVGITHTTNALLRKANVASHLTNSFLRTGNMAVHNTDANKRRADNVVSHTTSSNKRVANNTLSHTTNAILRKINVLSHSTDALKRTLNTVAHTTNSLLRKLVVLTHSTNSLKRTASVLSHNTNAMLRKANTVSHTTDANKKKTANTIFHTTSANLRKLYEVAHTTSSNLKKAYTVAHTTSTNKRLANNLLSHTTSAVVRKANVVSHATDALKRIAVTVSHTTDSFLRRRLVISHTTDANKKKLNNVVSHTTGSFLRGANQAFHNTDANKRKVTIVSHTTDASKKIILSVSHTTDTLLRRALSLTHTTSSNKRRATLVSHTTDALKRLASVVTHTTSANKRRPIEVSHTTNAFLRIRTVVSHATDSLLRKAQTVAHTTSANLKKSTTITHTTGSFLRAGNEAYHTTSANKRRADNTVTHTTSSNLRKPISITHTTDALLRKATSIVHTTNALLRKVYSVVHTTSSNKRKAGSVSHTTSANLRKATVLTHSTSSSLKTRQTVSHSTDSFLRKATAISHSTSANKRKATTVSHSTNSVLSGSFTVSHSTSSYLFAERGNKKVLVNGVWVYGTVKVLEGGIWVVKPVYVFDGTSWVLSRQ